MLVSLGLLAAPPTETLFEELKRYVRFTEDDARRIAGARVDVEPAFRRISEEFYDRIREHEGAHAVFTSEAQIAHLQASLVGWLERVFAGTYDETYFAKSQRIGEVHVRIGLRQHYVVSAMTLIRGSLFALIAAADVRDALSRLLDIDLAIMLESYRTDALARVERASTVRVAATDGVTDAAPVAIVGLDERGGVVLFNAAASSLTGWAADEIVGRRFIDVVLPTPGGAGDAFQRDGMFELDLVTRSGKLRRTRWRGAHVASERAGGALYLAFGADVTDEVEKRAHGEQEARLEAAGTLVAGLAHAIRNPLNGAGLHLALVERTLAKEGARDALDAARVAGAELRRLGGLVTDFLEFARPQPLAPASVDAREICLRAVEQTRGEAERHRVEILVDLPAQPLVFDADGPRLLQVLVYLLDNATDALKPGGGTVTVRARREPRNVWIEVEDSGPGLPDPEAPVFDAFYSTKPEGTGLGLAIVHRVVTDHRGEVDVESRPGCTRFRLRLPLARS